MITVVGKARSGEEKNDHSRQGRGDVGIRKMGKRGSVTASVKQDKKIGGRERATTT